MSARSAQPNVPGRGITASYGFRFWVLVALLGAVTGLAGAALIELLRAVQHLAWNYSSGPFLLAVEHASSERRVIVLLIGGLVAGLSALAMMGHEPGDVSEALWLRGARLPLVASIAKGVESIVIVALGASLGREAAPQQIGAAWASTLSDWAKLPDWQRRLLVACGAGSGMAAVYNVPFGGALFALEVLLGTLTLPLVLPALATSLTATAVAWVAVPHVPTYLIPHYGVRASQVVWALLAGPIAGVAAIAWIRLVARAHTLRPSSASARFLAPVVVFTALGVLAIQYPQLLGNGKPVVQATFVGELGAGLLAVLLVLKPLVTAACLGSGAPGGLFTPTLAYGVLLGALLGKAWVLIWPGAPIGTFAVIGGAAVLAASMQGPLAAVVLVLELTRQADGLMVPVLLAVVCATVVSRISGAPSIYSARLSAGPGEDPSAEPEHDLLPASLAP